MLLSNQKKFFMKVFVISMVLISALMPLSPYAEQLNFENRLEIALEKSYKEIKLYGNATEKTVSEIESILSEVNVRPTERGYGQWHNLGQGWRARVDRAHAGAGKPHVHVEKGSVKGVESVDGTKSHGKTLDNAGVPKKVRDKARALSDYKKGKEELKKMQRAKSQMRSKGLNLRKNSDIIIAIGIFITVVGFAVFATSAVGAWGAFLLLI